MFIGDKFVYLHLPKTAGTEIAQLLLDMQLGRRVGHPWRGIPSRSPHQRAPQRYYDGSYALIGSIRDPWDAYVSLWAFGCKQSKKLWKPDLASRLCRTNPLITLLHIMGHRKHVLASLVQEWRKPIRDWRRVYADAQDVRLFREWLRMLYSPERRFDVGEEYGYSPISAFAGFYTYRYLALYAQDPSPLVQPTALSDWNAVRAFAQEQIHMQYMIRTESLEQDLAEALQGCGIPLTDERRRLLEHMGRMNASIRKRSLGEYYDAETAALVADRERLIIERHGYRPPLLSQT